MAVRDIAWDYLKRLVGEGLTKNTIQESLIGVGLGYRRAVMLADIDTLLGQQVSQRALASFPKYFIPETAYTTATPKALKETYLYEFKSTGKSLVTGEAEDRVYSMYTDKPMTIRDAEESISDMVDKNESSPSYRIDSITLTTVWQKGKE